MNDTNQQYLDFLYEQLVYQYKRYAYYKNIDLPFNSTRLHDEIKILENCTEMYKNFYKKRIEVIRKKLTKTHNKNIKSYLTLDVEYYNKQYSLRMEEIDNYLNKLSNIDIDSITTVDLGNISPVINYNVSELILTPSLFNLIN